MELSNQFIKENSYYIHKYCGCNRDKCFQKRIIGVSGIFRHKNFVFCKEHIHNVANEIAYNKGKDLNRDEYHCYAYYGDYKEAVKSVIMNDIYSEYDFEWYRKIRSNQRNFRERYLCVYLTDKIFECMPFEEALKISTSNAELDYDFRERVVQEIKNWLSEIKDTIKYKTHFKKINSMINKKTRIICGDDFHLTINEILTELLTIKYK